MIAFPPQVSPPRWLAYLAAVLVTTLALLVTLVTPTLYAQGTPILLLVAVTLSVAYGGFGPGLLATVLTVLLSVYYLLPPYHSFVLTAEEAPRLAFFIIAALLICYLNEAWRRSREAEQQGRERASFLAELTQALSSSLESKDILSSIIRLTVPRFADWCVVNLVDKRGRIQAAEIGHVDHARAAILRQYIQTYPLQPHAASATGQALRSGQSVFYPRIRLDAPAAYRLDEQHRQFLQALGYESAMTIPLGGRVGCLGAITLVRASPDRLFTTADLITAEELAQRVAAALDNARLYAEAQALSQAREHLLHVVSHDLKNPLTAIRGFLHLMRRRVERLPDEAAAPLLDPLARIDEASIRMSEMIKDLVNAAVLDQAVAVDFRLTDLADLTQRVVAQHQAATPDRPIQVQTNGPVVSLVDEGRLARVLDNLISNAMKYTPEGGLIQVKVDQEQQPDGAWGVISVQDEGIGIPAVDLPYIFEPFHRASNAQAIEGTGLGLASAQQIVEGHGGQVMVESREGHGSTFSIRLPLAPDI
ncbi:MAG: DUF4118 domain-containing protein [Anaerolineae bacterium]|nr:DUF4118 domain-containing protein [Anaerolineae bacterium]